MKLPRDQRFILGCVCTVLVATIAACDSNSNLPTEAEIASCLIFTTVNDDWYWSNTELKEGGIATSTVVKFDEKIRAAAETSCSFLFDEQDKSSQEIISQRMHRICKEDLKNNNPFFGKGLHCKQTLAL